MKDKKMNETSNMVMTISMDQVVANRYQPRKNFDDAELAELSDSIKQHGILQPIILREVTEGMYEIIAGERRFRAAKLAGLEEVEAIVKDVSPTDGAILALVENIQRADLTAIEEAKSYNQLMSLYSRTQNELAEMVGISQSALANKLRLLQLSEEVQKGIERKVISERHGRALLKVKDPAIQVEIYDWIVKNNLTVAETEKYIEKHFNNENLKEDKGGTIVQVAKDTKLAVNTINKAVNTIKEFGMDVDYSTTETETEYVLQIVVPKHFVDKAQGPIVMPHEKTQPNTLISDIQEQLEDVEQMGFRTTAPQQEAILKDKTKSIVLDLDLTSETVFFKPEKEKIEITDDENE